MRDGGTIAGGQLKSSTAGIALLIAAVPAPIGGASTGLAPVPAAVAAAPVALLVDLSAGQTLYARAADRRFQPASMTKAMSALVAFDLIKAGKLDPAAGVTVAPALSAQWAGKGTTLSLRAGEWITVARLIEGMITASANDATEVLAQHAAGSRKQWIALMNARARSLGMADSTFASPSGWPDGGKTLVTARDMVRLARALIEEHPQLYRRYFGHPAMAWRGGVLSSRNPFAGRFPGADGIKTGHTSQAGYNFLGAIERDGRRLVLLIGGAPNEAARAGAAGALAGWGYTAWESRPLVAKGQVVGAARVQGGADRQVELVPLRDWRLAIPRGSTARVTTRLVYRGPLRAPLEAGQVVAGLEVSIAGQPAHDIPLATRRRVTRAGPFDRVVNGLLELRL